MLRSAEYLRRPSADLRCLSLCSSLLLWCYGLGALGALPSLASQLLLNPGSPLVEGVNWIFPVCPWKLSQASDLGQSIGLISFVFHLRYDSPSLSYVQCLKNCGFIYVVHFLFLLFQAGEKIWSL